MLATRPQEMALTHADYLPFVNRQTSTRSQRSSHLDQSRVMTPGL